MISLVSRRAVSWFDLTDWDARILARTSLKARQVYLQADKADAESMYMLTDDAPGAARSLLSQMGLTSDEQKAREISREQTYRGSGC